jgi:pSer/pThr/pTyr-binding forkhead associated (FHA) protein
MLIGRHSDADIRLALPDVSRRHCRIVFAHGAWQLFDLSSLNGVFVNGERVQRASLKEGDQLKIGGLVFDIRVGSKWKDNPAPDLAARPSVLRGVVESLPLGATQAPHRRKAS